MTITTPRVVLIFLGVGTLASYLVLLATERLLLFVEYPQRSYEEIQQLAAGPLGILVVTCLLVLPAQVVTSAFAGLAFSFTRRVPLWTVLLLVPLCGLFATYRDVTLDGYPATISLGLNEVRKLLYWTFVVSPGQLVSAAIVAKSVGVSHAGQAKA